MTTLTLVTVAVIAYGMFGRRGYGRALALGGSTAAGAALAFGSTALPTFYAVSLGVVVALAFRLLGGGLSKAPVRQHLPPEVPMLLLFLAWSALVTLVAPQLFDGMAVLAPDGGDSRLVAGLITASNLAQLLYLVLGVAVVVFLARSPMAGPELVGLAAGLTTLLSLWRYLHEGVGLPFPEDFFDNSPGFTYIETAPNDVQRFRGILSEPAGLAVSSLVTISYMIPRAVQLRGWRRAGALSVAAVAAFLGSISTSATFVVAGGAVLVIAALTFVSGFLLRRTSVSAVVSVVTCVLVVVALWVLPIVADFVAVTVDEKVSSSSFDDRSSSNSESYEIFFNTFGFGVGLGASRASSFFAGLLSTTGLIGTLLFLAAVAGLFRRSAAVREYRPVVWALVTLLVVKTISGPDLSDTSGILWLALGLLSHAALVAAQQSAVDESPEAAPLPPPPSGPPPEDLRTAPVPVVGLRPSPRRRGPA